MAHRVPRLRGSCPAKRWREESLSISSSPGILTPMLPGDIYHIQFRSSQKGSVCLHGAFPRILLFADRLQRLISKRELTAHSGSLLFLMFQSNRGFWQKESAAVKLLRCRLRINLLMSIPEPSKSLPTKHQRTQAEDSSEFDKAEEKEDNYAENMTLCQLSLLSSTVQKSL